MTTERTKKKKTKGGRYSHEITKEEIELYYHLPCEEASRHLGIGLTILKRICRRLGIEKWPYRQLKRAGKLGEVAAASAAHAPHVPGAAAAGAAAPPSPFQSSPAPKLAGTPARKRTPAKKKPAKEQSSQEEDEEEEEPEQDVSSSEHVSHGSGSEASWQRRGGTPHATPAASQQWPAASGGGRSQASEPLAPGVPAPVPLAGRRRSSDIGVAAAAAAYAQVQAQRGAGGPRRASLDLGALARARGHPASPQPSGSTAAGHSGGGSATTGGGTAGASMQQQQGSGYKRRIRDEDLDQLMRLMEGGFTETAQESPFSAMAKLPPEGMWTPPGREDGGAEQLAAGLSRLAMRTLSLKRQCSREQADALEHALRMERMEAAAGGTPLVSMTRSSSAPHHRPDPRASPPPASGMPYGARLPPRMGTSVPSDNGFGWLAAEQVRLSPPPKQQHSYQQQQQPASAAQIMLQRAGVMPAGGRMGAGGLEGMDEPLNGEISLSLPDPTASLTALLFGPSAANTPQQFLPSPSDGDLAFDSCLLPESGNDGSAPGNLPISNSSVMLLECGEAGKPKPDASCQTAARLSPLDAEFLGFGQQPLGPSPAAGVTPVGQQGQQAAANVEEQLDRARLVKELGGSFKFKFGSTAAEEDQEVDNLLADFLSPAPSDLAEARLGELLGAFSPKASPRFGAGLEDPALAGIVRTPRAPSRLGQGPPGAPPAQGGGGAGSSHDTPTSSAGTGVLIGASGGLDLPLHLSTAPSSDFVPLTGGLARFAPEPSQGQQGRMLPVMQQGQQAQQAPAWQQYREAQEPAASTTTTEELQQAVQQHQALAQLYLQHRSEVQAMLAKRGSAHQLGSLAGDGERLQQLARLKALKTQLAAAQARQVALRQKRDGQLGGQLGAAPAAPMQQQQQAQQAAGMMQPSFMSDVSAAFHGGSGPRLGPPPPLPSGPQRTQSAAAAQFASAMMQRAGSHEQQQQQQQQAQAMENLPSIAALLQQWRGGNVVGGGAVGPAAGQGPSFEARWAAGSASRATWAPAADAAHPQSQGQPAFQAQFQPRAMPAAMQQRTASAPLPWEVEWRA